MRAARCAVASIKRCVAGARASAKLLPGASSRQQRARLARIEIIFSEEPPELVIGHGKEFGAALLIELGRLKAALE
jgi:hypothetical protein